MNFCHREEAKIKELKTLPKFMRNAQILYRNINNSIYIMGAYNISDCYVYSCKNNKYELITKYPLNIIPKNHSIIYLNNKLQNNILSLGYCNYKNNNYNHFLIYNIANNEWDLNKCNNIFTRNIKGKHTRIKNIKRQFNNSYYW